MKRAALITLVLLFGSALLTAPLLVSAQNVEVRPSELDFGEVDVATSTPISFRFLSTGPVPLTVHSIRFTDDSSDTFFFEEFLLNGTIPIPDGLPPPAVIACR